MINFELFKAKSLNEALDILNTFENVKIIAGGTDLVVDLKRGRKKLPVIEYLLDISTIHELSFIRQSDDFIEIGPLVTHNMIINNSVIKENFPVLIEAAKVIGSNQIRNRGTIGGNICNAATCADLLPPLTALRAEVQLESKEGARTIPIEEFVTGNYKNALSKNEMLTCIRVPILKKHYYSYYYKLGRRKALNISRLTIVLIASIENGKFEDVRFVPGAVTSRPTVFYETSSEIEKMQIDSMDYDKLESTAVQEMLQMTGRRWSTEYKTPVLAGLIRRALEEVKREAKEYEHA